MNVLLAADCESAMHEALRAALATAGLCVHMAKPGETLDARALESCRFAVLYRTRFDGETRYPVDEALCRYVAGGGGLFMMHGAIAMGTAAEKGYLAHLAGGAIAWLPQMGEHTYFGLPDGHAIAEGVDTFTMRDADLRLTIDRFADNRVFLRMRYLNTSMPAGWARAHGLGRVAYLGPGHRPDAFDHAPWRRLFDNGCAWLAGEGSAV